MEPVKRIVLVLFLLLALPGTSAASVLDGKGFHLLALSENSPLDAAFAHAAPLMQQEDIVDLVDRFDSYRPSSQTATALDADGSDAFSTLPLTSSLLSPSYHDFMILGTTGGTSEDFIMSGAYHTLLQGAPATFTDVYLTVHDYTQPDGLYQGELQMNISCGNGTLTWLMPPDGLLLDGGDGLIFNGSLTFISASVNTSVASLNEALASFTFTPTSPSFHGNTSCPYSISTNASLFISQFTFDVLAEVTMPTAESVQVSFNLSVAPPLTSQYSLYTQLAMEVADALYASPDRILVVSVDIEDEYTAIVMDFLPLPGSSLAAGSALNDTAQELFDAFIALTPAQTAHTTWLQYAELQSVEELCADGSYRLTCVVAIPAATAAAAAGITATLGFIVGISVAGLLVVLVASVAVYQRAHRRSGEPPSSPMIKSVQLLENLHPELPELLASGEKDVQALADAISLAIDDHTEEAPVPLRRKSSKVSLLLKPPDDAPIPPVSLRRPPIKRSSRVSRAVLSRPKHQDGADRLERDLQEKLRKAGLNEGRRYLYQPGVIIHDERAQEVIEKRESIIQQMEAGGSSTETRRGSVISSAYDSKRSSFFSPSVGRSSSPHIPPIRAPRGHLHYARAYHHDDSEDEDDLLSSDGPRFLDATRDATLGTPERISVQHREAVDVAEVRVDVNAQGGLAAFSRGEEREDRRRSLGSRKQSDSATRRLHIGYQASRLGSPDGSHSPSFSTREVADHWLNANEEPDTEQQPYSDNAPSFPLPSPLPLLPISKLPPPSVLSSILDSKRRSWSSKAPAPSKAQRITLDLSKAAQPHPSHAKEGKEDKGKGYSGQAGLSLLPNASAQARLSVSHQRPVS